MRIDQDETVEPVMSGLEIEGLEGLRIIVAHPEDPISRAVELFREYDLHHLPIVRSENDATVVGIVSLFDLIKDDSEAPWAERTLGSIMTAEPQTITRRTLLKEAVSILATSQFMALPVVDDQKRILGIVTTRDITRFLNEQYEKRWSIIP